MESHPREAKDRYEFPASVRVLAQSGLASQLIDQLAMRLEETPATPLFRELVDLYRRVGDLERAVEKAREWMRFDPSGSQAAYMACLLNGRKPPGEGYPLDQMHPAPFAILDKFLTPDEREHFWRLALGSEEEFLESGFARKDEPVMDRHSRRTRVLKLGAADKGIIQGKLQPLVDGLLLLFSIPAMPYKEIEIKMTAHSQGGFFGIHQDGFKDIKGSERYLSWIYYFHSQPKRYAGGDLILFDSNRLREDHRMDVGKYTRYRTVDNQLVCFPSFYYHGVTPVELLQPDFECNRFAISGHVRF